MSIKRIIPLKLTYFVNAVLISISSLHPAIWTIDHISYITCHYLPSFFYTSTKLYCLVPQSNLRTACPESLPGKAVFLR